MSKRANTTETAITTKNNKTKGGKYTPFGERTVRHYQEMGFSLKRISDTQCSMLLHVQDNEGNEETKTLISCVGISRLYSGKMLCGILKGTGFLSEGFEFAKTEPKTQRERIAEAKEAAVTVTITATIRRLIEAGLPIETAQAVIGDEFSTYAPLIETMYAAEAAKNA